MNRRGLGSRRTGGIRLRSAPRLLVELWLDRKTAEPPRIRMFVRAGSLSTP